MTNDEAYIHLSATFNKQNFLYWAESNPRELYQKHCIRNGLRCGARLENAAFWGPYFFEENGQTTVTSACYTEMLRKFVKPKTDTVKIII